MNGLSAPSFRFQNRSTFGPDAVEQNAGGFVIRVLRDEFAPEGFGQKGGFETVKEGQSALGFEFEAIDTTKSYFKALFDFFLSVKTDSWNLKR
ncbi:hypothetical protein AAJCM20276_04600 [Acetobacter aceti]|uniref:Uncharacterized protein n=1 Tax=Acetobacter aceti TaxID=435 RepID=A0A6S6PFT9_ACEAC|nr:hypothetical protein AAJCM20276_04600 [Acetobacter aceti]